MFYLTEAEDIQQAIAELTTYSTLWIDTEVANWNTSSPQLSLIQILANPEDLLGNYVYILDVLEREDLVKNFRDKIMASSLIEKVFHNASFDLRFLGKERTYNITCTLKIARDIGCDRLNVSNLKLKTLAAKIGKFSNIDIERGTSNWQQRPLSKQQLQYAKMDPVYLAQIHHYLLEENNRFEWDSAAEVNSSDNFPFNVSNVRVAVECPRLFYLAHHFGGLTLFKSLDTPSGIGNTFHKLADRLIQTFQKEPRFEALLKPEPEQLNVEEVASNMQAWFYQLCFSTYLQTANPEVAPVLLQVWQGLIAIIKHWSQLLISNRRYCQADEVISKTFPLRNLCSKSHDRVVSNYLEKCYNVDHEFLLPNGKFQLVRGTFDNLIYDFERRRLCVVEYKTYGSADRSAQLAQVSLYGYMLNQKWGVPIDAAIYCILPQWKEINFSWEMLEGTVNQLIPYKLQQMREWVAWKPSQTNPPPPTIYRNILCGICPQQRKCKSFYW